MRTKLKLSQFVATTRSWQDAYCSRKLIKCNRNSSYEVEGPITTRVLVCAQSNVALKELVSRIYKHGFYPNGFASGILDMRMHHL
jgi:hypothetical protein